MFDAYRKLANDPKKAMTAIHNDIYPGTVYLLATDSTKRIVNILDSIKELFLKKDKKNFINTIIQAKNLFQQA